MTLDLTIFSCSTKLSFMLCHCLQHQRSVQGLVSSREEFVLFEMSWTCSQEKVMSLLRHVLRHVTLATSCASFLVGTQKRSLCGL